MKYLSVALFIASFALFIAAIWVTDYWWQCLASALVFFFAGGLTNSTSTNRTNHRP